MRYAKEVAAILLTYWDAVDLLAFETAECRAWFEQPIFRQPIFEQQF